MPIGVIADIVLLPVSTNWRRSTMALGRPALHVYVTVLPELLPPLEPLTPPLDELPLVLLPELLPLLDAPPPLDEPPPPLEPLVLSADPLLVPPELLPFPEVPTPEELLPPLHAAVAATTNGTTQTIRCAMVHSVRRIAVRPVVAPLT
jgi:hypothetical protein